MKKILLLSNFESYSKNAVSYAMQLCRGQQCHFYFLNIVKVWTYTTDDLITASSSDTIYETVLSSSKERLKKEVSLLKKRYAEEDFEFTAITDYDVFTDAINQAVNAYDIDVIIMGSDGQHDFTERIFGSHSTRVFRKVNCPILMVPDEYQYAPASHLLIVLGEKASYSSSIFDYAFKLFFKEKLTASLLRLSDWEPINIKEEILRAARDFKQETMPYFRLSNTTEDKGEQLHSVDEAIQADINIVCTTPSSIASRLFQKSAVASIISKVEKPTLFLRP